MGAPEEDRRRLRELNVLAAGHCAAGRYEAAVPLFEQVVAGCTAGFGADDPDTLIGHGNLVVTQLRLDPRGSALSGLDANVAARRRVFGDRHPATLRAEEARDAAYDRAADVLERALVEYTAAVGPDHPETVALCTELARLYARHAQQPVVDFTPVGGPAPTTAPVPRRPRGARFLRSLPDQRSAEVDVQTPVDHAGAGGAPPPRGARFPRGTA
jgi:hypothetical protein